MYILVNVQLTLHTARCLNSVCKIVTLYGTYLAGISATWPTAISLVESDNITGSQFSK